MRDEPDAATDFSWLPGFLIRAFWKFVPARHRKSEPDWHSMRDACATQIRVHSCRFAVKARLKGTLNEGDSRDRPIIPAGVCRTGRRGVLQAEQRSGSVT